jgi:hypothetical protein
MPIYVPKRILLPTQIPPAGGASGALVADRRRGDDRRQVSVRTFLQGGLTPRRRMGRRRSDAGYLVDWHEPHLLFMAIAILLMSMTDALFTLTLLANGAEEMNPVMKYLLVSYPRAFAVVKMALTGVGVMILVACARATVFRVIRVSTVMHWFLLGYVVLIGYEWWLLQQLV